MSTGFGSAPMSTTPYGFGTPDSAGDLGGKPLLDADGNPTGSRAIVDGKYTFNAYGRHVGMPNVRQLVYIAVSTQVGSSAMVALGQDLRSIDRVTVNFSQRVTNEMNVALADIVARGLMRITSIQVEKPSSRPAFILLRWVDLTTGKEDTLEVT